MLITDEHLKKSSKTKKKLSWTNRQWFMVRGLLGRESTPESLVGRHLTESWWNRFMDAKEKPGFFKKQWRCGGFYRE